MIKQFYIYLWWKYGKFFITLDLTVWNSNWNSIKSRAICYTLILYFNYFELIVRYFFLLNFNWLLVQTLIIVFILMKWKVLRKFSYKNIQTNYAEMFNVFFSVLLFGVSLTFHFLFIFPLNFTFSCSILTSARSAKAFFWYISPVNNGTEMTGSVVSNTTKAAHKQIDNYFYFICY